MTVPRPLFPVLITALLAAGCATVPDPLAGECPATTPDLADDSHVGQNVRWGGRIVDTRPGTDETCIEILARPLDSKARPSDSERPYGRFRSEERRVGKECRRRRDKGAYTTW